MPSQVRNDYSQKNLEAHLDSALAFNKEPNLNWTSNRYLPIILLRSLYWGWLVSLISSLQHGNNKDQEIGDDQSEGRGTSSLTSDIKDIDLDQQ